MLQFSHANILISLAELARPHWHASDHNQPWLTAGYQYEYAGPPRNCASRLVRSHHQAMLVYQVSRSCRRFIYESSLYK